MKKPQHYTLLLDEGLPPRESLPLTNARHTLKHIRNDLNNSRMKDSEIYKLCVKKNWLIVTLNKKDFYKYATTDKKTGIIGVHEMISSQIDKKLLSLLSSKNRGDLYGHYNVLSGDN